MKRLLASLFSLVGMVRQEAYARRWLKSSRLSRPVISVGNLSTGGTGKTPLCIWLASLLRKEGLDPIILSRGYGGRAEKENQMVSSRQAILLDPEEAGDEPWLMARRLEGVPVLVGRDRARSARLAPVSERTVFILDDGFQHLQLQRNIDLLAVDATRPFTRDLLLPAGRLRERPEAASRADAFVITRTHQIEDLEPLLVELHRLASKAPAFSFASRLCDAFDFCSRERTSLSSLQGEPVLALAGIGNPEAFFRDLEEAGLVLVGRKTYRDHYPYTPADASGWLQEAQRAGARRVVTTEKDWARLRRFKFPEGHLLVVPMSLEEESPGDFASWLLAKLDRSSV